MLTQGRRWGHVVAGCFLIVALLCTARVARGEAAPPTFALASGLDDQFNEQVDHRVDVPPVDRQRYLAMLMQALGDAGIADLAPQAFVVVDRSPAVQAAFVVLRTAEGTWDWVGSTAVSTGRVGTYDHFLTPLGVFDHTPDNPDFRAEGTFNKNHIRGYGLRGRRVFDFGWQSAERGWGAGGVSKMRLQMHATDPNVLEARLGAIASEGCIRIPATLNVFLDRHGILDAPYEAAVSAGKPQWVLKRDRQTTAFPGRYLVIVDSKTPDRPDWSPTPAARAQTVPGPAKPTAPAERRATP